MESKYLTKIVAACLLGDGCVKIRPCGHKNAHFVLAQTEDHYDHVLYIKNILSELTHVNEWTKENFSKGSGKNPKVQKWIETRTHPFYTKFRERMYPNGHKVVDPHYLTLLDWEFLAIWYMQDGSVCSNGTHASIRIATHNFSYGDNHCLRQALADKLGILFNVVSSRRNNKQYYSLSLNSKSNECFLENVSPYVQHSFSYKIPKMVGSKIILDEDIV